MIFRLLLHHPLYILIISTQLRFFYKKNQYKTHRGKLIPNDDLVILPKRSDQREASKEKPKEPFNV